MAAGVFGEVSEDGSTLIVIASGDAHEVKQAAAALRLMTPLFTPTDPPGALRGPLTWVTVTQLGFTFNGASLGRWCPGPRLAQWITAELIRRTAAGEMSEAVLAGLPEGLAPRPYQAQAAVMIGALGKCLLFDEAGSGKTPSAILGLLERQARGHEVFPLVIIVPSWDVGDVWARHIRDWAPGWPEPALYAGTSRRELLRRDPDGLILITTYATTRLDAADSRGPLARLACAVICDEVHLTKNAKSLQSQAVRVITRHAGTFIGLSGTPVTRDTADVYPALEAMEPASWPSRERFVKRYCLTTAGEYEEKVEGLAPLMEPEFRAALLGQYRRVAKADVLDQLPPKVYSTRRVELPPPWRRAYDQMAADMLAELPDGGDLEVMSVLAQLTRLSQLASSACDVAVRLEPDAVTGELKKHFDVTLKAPSWKADCLLEVLAERKGQQVAAFAVSRQLADITRAACEREGYKTGAITGGQGKRARKNDISAFQAGNLDVMIATAGAGSLGITLTAAGTIVMLQRSWQLDQSLQAEDRAHRLDDIVLRHDCIEVIDIIAKGTVDEKVRTLLREKSGQLGQLVRDPRIARELFGGLR